MKKVFLVLGVCGMFAFASCNSKKDCDCTAKMTSGNFPLYVEGTPTITEWDGDCEDLKFSDLNEEWRDFDGAGVTLSCVEH